MTTEEKITSLWNTLGVLQRGKNHACQNADYPLAVRYRHMIDIIHRKIEMLEEEIVIAEDRGRTY